MLCAKRRCRLAHLYMLAGRLCAALALSFLLSAAPGLERAWAAPQPILVAQQSETRPRPADVSSRRNRQEMQAVPAAAPRRSPWRVSSAGPPLLLGLILGLGLAFGLTRLRRPRSPDWPPPRFSEMLRKSDLLIQEENLSVIKKRLEDIWDLLKGSVGKFPLCGGGPSAEAHSNKASSGSEALPEVKPGTVVALPAEADPARTPPPQAPEGSDGSASPAAKAAPETHQVDLQARARYLRNLGSRMMNDGLLPGAESNFRQSFEIIKKLADREPDNQACLRDLVLAYHNMGRVMECREQLEESAEFYRQSIRLTSGLVGKAPGNFDWLRGLSASHGHLGRILTGQGQAQEALRHLEKDAELMRGLVKKRPDRKPWRQALSASLHNLAQAHEKTGRPEEALAGYQEEMELTRRLLEEEPDNRACAGNLSSVCGAIGRLLTTKGQVDEALKITERYVELMRGLVRSRPEDGLLQRELTVALGQTGRLHEVSGDVDQALNHFEEALGIRRKLADREPDNALRQGDLAMGLCRVGDAYLTGKRLEKTKKCYLEALEVLERLEKRHGPHGEWLLKKGELLLRLGNAYKAAEPERAGEYYRRGLELVTPRLGGPGEPAWSDLAAAIKENMGTAAS